MDDIHVIRLRARLLLQQTGLSVCEFARLHNIQDEKAYLFFCKDRMPPLTVTAQVCEAFGVSMDWMLGIREPRVRPLVGTIGDQRYAQRETPV